MKKKIHISALTWLSACGLCMGGVEAIRVFNVQSNVLEYVFTGVVSSQEPVMLSFNDRRNRTHFAHVGEGLGEYVVKSFVPMYVKEFKPGVSDYLRKSVGIVTLEDKDGREYTLQEAESTFAPGLMARVIALNTLETAELREGDSVALGGAVFTVRSVAPDAVIIDEHESERTLAFISEEEKELVRQRYKARQEQEARRMELAAQERSRSAAASEAEDDAGAASGATSVWYPATQPSGSYKQRPSMFIGNEYAAPTVYQNYYDAGGRLIYSRTIYPYQFWSYPYPWRRSWKRRSNVPQPKSAQYRGGIYFETGDIDVGGVTVRGSGVIGGRPAPPEGSGALPPAAPEPPRFGVPGKAPPFSWP